MSVKQHNNFNPEFPEQFNWELLDSFKLTPIATAIAAKIKEELSLLPEQRICMAGLRYALNVIAEKGNI